MDHGIKPIVLQEIRDIAKNRDIETVILFGSRARGDYHRTSDIDIAVRGSDVVGFTLDVKESTSTLLEFDIVDLNDDLQELFREEIIKEGVIIYEKV